ncbi:MAG: UDP-3-O-acyl-N-acetylglucosamine deacetylase [Candidatus Aadella gelida]|nr:UDP-3-O-acyl-N-acetylglucosamine deacetylase [Candidatus Aadella gelida]
MAEIRQKTIRDEISFSGKGLQTGAQVSVVCRPAGEGSGIVFLRTDTENSVPIRVNDGIFSVSEKRRSTIGMGPHSVQTIEHLMAALWALEIDNVQIDINGAELPALDGSAKGFLDILGAAGISEQNAPRHIVKITEKEEVSDGKASITILPNESFKVSYSIDYAISSIPRETFTITLDNNSFIKEIAPARTFCLKQEAEQLLKAGLGKGADCENTLVMDETGPVGTVLRFPNEPLRHKILDLVGDMYMLGRPIMGEIIAERSGHALNALMAEKLFQKYVRNRS